MASVEQLGLTSRSSVLNRSRVCIDKLNKYLFCCVGSTVRIYALPSGHCYDELKHDAQVVAVHLNPNNFLQILTCTDVGKISLWNYEEGTLLKTWDLNKKVESFLVCNRKDIIGFVCCPDGFKVCTAYKVRINDTGDEVGVEKIAANVPESFKKFSCDPKGKYIAFVNNNTLFIHSSDTNAKYTKFQRGEGRSFECVTCHPSKDCIATGDSAGRITLWYNFFEKSFVNTYFHWHNSKVNDIAFPKEGSSMYSGGEECVAVKWNLETSYKQETKEFLSRLSGSICSLAPSPDNQYVAIVLNDNSIQVASSQMEITTSITGFATNDWYRISKFSKIPRLGLRYDNVGVVPNLTEGCLIANGRPGHVQFYHPEKDSLLYSHDVVERNLPPAEASTYCDVTHLDFCANWMATVEYRRDETFTNDFALKFWTFDEVTNKLNVNSTAENPHFKMITCIQFRPMTTDKDNFGPCLVTTSLDGNAKVWSVIEIDDVTQGGTKLSWTCERTMNYRNRPSACCRFNKNGKVLCVSFGNSLTFWKFDDHTLLVSFPVVGEKDHIKQIEFGSLKHERKLICILANSGLCSVWDIDNQVQIWNVGSMITALCFHPVSGLFAAFSPKNAYCFNLSTGKPIFQYDAPAEQSYLSLDRIVSACFSLEIPESHQKTESCSAFDAPSISPVLYTLTNSGNVNRLCTEAKSIQLSDRYKVGKSLSVEGKASTNLAKLLTAAKYEAAGKSLESINIDTRLLDQKANLEILNAPAHTLPSLQKLGLNFVQSCLQPKVSNNDFQFKQTAGDRILFSNEREDVDSADVRLETSSVRNSSKTSILKLRTRDLDLFTSYFENL